MIVAFWSWRSKAYEKGMKKSNLLCETWYQFVYVAVYEKGGLKSATSRKLKKTNKTAIFSAISLESVKILARLQFFLKWAHYLEIKSKNTSKVERDFDQYCTLSVQYLQQPI